MSNIPQFSPESKIMQIEQGTSETLVAYNARVATIVSELTAANNIVVTQKAVQQCRKDDAWKVVTITEISYYSAS